MEGDQTNIDKQVGLHRVIGLNALTTELLLVIFEFVDYITIGRISQVCQRWNAIAELISTRDIFGSYIRLAKYSRNQITPRCIQRHTEAVLDVVATRSGFCSCCGDSSVAVWNKDGVLLYVLEGNKSEVLAVAATSDGNIFSGSQDGVLSMWVLPCTTPAKQHNLGNHAAIESVTFYDGRLYCSHGNCIYVWTDAGDLLQTLESHELTSVLVVANPPPLTLSSNKYEEGSSGSMLISGSYSGKLRLWSNEGGLLVSALIRTFEVSALATSPCSKLVFMTLFRYCDDCEICVFSLNRTPNYLLLVYVIKQPGPISSLVTYGNNLYAGAWDSRIRVFEYAYNNTGDTNDPHHSSISLRARHPKVLQHHTAAVYCMSVSSNGRLFSGGKDSICIW
eukprot:m.193036 g.193036  ORF g.193036 m.193036 type:complete len:392 (-) comp32491_c0_seq2:393-1568(-)